MHKECLCCSKIFEIPEPKFCSTKCRREVNGHSAWNKGMRIPIDAKTIDKNPGRWKGDEAGRQAKHTRIIKQYGRADHCENCGIEGLKYYHWSNKDHKYTMNRNDWQQLCPKCHRIFDVKVGIFRKNY